MGPFDIYFYDTLENDILIKWDGNLIFDKLNIFPLKYATYYDYTICVPNNSEEIVKNLYGDTWNIPMNKDQYVWKSITYTRFL